tara:strand:+ start:12586 stop:13188 length:603 start_codon:yes stop_codon:yes gene_type:complete
MHLELSKEQEKKLKDFSHEVIERNKQHNLTGHKDAKTFYNLQVVDCISAYSVCKKTVAENIVDCGSGAGLPSVVWAILSPEKKFYSIDKNEKKIQFQKQLLIKLNIENVETHLSKIEEFNLDKQHTVVIKAFSSVAKTIEQLKNKQHQKNLIFLKKDDKKTEEELLEVPSLLYDYKKHQYVLNKEKMVALELYDSKNSHN